ncbi:MAG: tetratricopeptide repeat protein, partial [Deltaproteobacteria bacterium]|nr:tetratricopeptide repeat protein [Deltaproteobacteria bacterium]
GTAEAPSGGADEARGGGSADDGLDEFGFGDSVVVAVEPNLDDFEAFREEARALFAAGEFAEAASVYEAATQMNPVHAGTFAGLGAARLHIGETEAGLAAYQEAVRLAPTHSGFHAALGRAYRGAGRDGLALESYREALRLDRRNRIARRAIRELEGN